MLKPIKTILISYNTLSLSDWEPSACLKKHSKSGLPIFNWQNVKTWTHLLYGCIQYSQFESILNWIELQFSQLTLLSCRKLALNKLMYSWSAKIHFSCSGTESVQDQTPTGSEKLNVDAGFHWTAEYSNWSSQTWKRIYGMFDKSCWL